MQDPTFQFVPTMHLESERLTYAKFTGNDLPDYMNLVTREEVMKHITGVKHNTEQARERFHLPIGQISADGFSRSRVLLPSPLQG
jgi:hypothetical protein